MLLPGRRLALLEQFRELLARGIDIHLFAAIEELVEVGRLKLLVLLEFVLEAVVVVIRPGHDDLADLEKLRLVDGDFWRPRGVIEVVIKEREGPVPGVLADAVVPFPRL